MRIRKIFLIIGLFLILASAANAQVSAKRLYSAGHDLINLSGVVIFDIINVTGRIVGAPGLDYNFNTSSYLGGSDVNASLVKSTNSTFFNLFSRVVDSFSRSNLTDFFGSDLDINNTILRRTNTSFFSTFWTISNF